MKAPNLDYRALEEIMGGGGGRVEQFGKLFMTKLPICCATNHLGEDGRQES